MRIHRPLRTEEPVSGGSQTGGEVMRLSRRCLGVEVTVLHYILEGATHGRSAVLSPTSRSQDVRYGTLKPRRLRTGQCQRRKERRRDH